MTVHEANNNAQPKPNFRSAKAFLRLARVEDRVEAFTIPELHHCADVIQTDASTGAC
jgi:hypothetical protein